MELLQILLSLLLFLGSIVVFFRIFKGYSKKNNLIYILSLLGVFVLLVLLNHKVYENLIGLN